MEQLGIKVSVMLAILTGAVYRLYKVKSREETKLARAIDMGVTFTVSILFALVLLHPFMAFFSIPIAYESAAAMFLALSSEAFLRSVLRGVEDFNAAKIFQAWILKRYGVKVDADLKDERKEDE